MNRLERTWLTWKTSSKKALSDLLNVGKGIWERLVRSVRLLSGSPGARVHHETRDLEDLGEPWQSPEKRSEKT